MKKKPGDQRISLQAAMHCILHQDRRVRRMVSNRWAEIIDGVLNSGIAEVAFPESHRNPASAVFSFIRRSAAG
jgi:hypothetical protein